MVSGLIGNFRFDLMDSCSCECCIRNGRKAETSLHNMAVDTAEPIYMYTTHLKISYHVIPSMFHVLLSMKIFDY